VPGTDLAAARRVRQNALVQSDLLRPLRDTVDSAGANDPAAFARAARNAVAQAILAAALAPDADAGRPDHEPPTAEVRDLLGPDVGDALTELYRGGDDWTSRAIDLLEPLNALAHAR
jgi:predicted methyltransferase